MGFRSLLALMLVCAAGHRASRGAPHATGSLDEAIALFAASRYPAARAMLEAITAAEPRNAAACYYLGRTLELRADESSLREAVDWLGRAAVLEPRNATYLARFGGASLLLAERNSSLVAAIRGRDALLRALELEPGDLDAREGLMHFYLRAPWPLGSRARAEAQLAAIRARDPARATSLSVGFKVDAGDFAGAFELCEAVLAQAPLDYTANFHYGRTAALSGLNLERGRAALQQCLRLTPPGPASPAPAAVWLQLGAIDEKRGQKDRARAAYEASLRLEPGNRQAAAALAKLAVTRP